jgi:hypothetical protein
LRALAVLEEDGQEMKSGKTGGTVGKVMDQEEQESGRDEEKKR